MEYVGEDNLSVMDNAKNYNAFIVSQIAARLRPQDDAVLDFGAGNGLLARMVERKTGKKVVCLEPAENMKKYLSGKVLDSLDEAADGSFDFIYSSNVLEHIEDDAAVVGSMVRALKPDGRLFLYLPAFDYLYSAMDRKVGHFRRYDKKKLKALFDPAKWEIEDLRYADGLGFLAALLFKAVGSKSGDVSPASLFIYDRFVFPFSRLFDKLTGGKLFGKNVLLCAKRK